MTRVLVVGSSVVLLLPVLLVGMMVGAVEPAAPATSAPVGDLAGAVLASPNIDLRPGAAADVRAGIVDARVLAVLLMLADHHRLAGVGPIATGHSRFVAGTNRVSHHSQGRAVDIGAVDGEAVTAANTGALAVARRVLALPPALRPQELGGPWPLDGQGVEIITKNHATHLHLGWSR